MQSSITQHLLNRPLELKALKEKGVKIIGYNIGDFVPEELIYAAGAVPVCQIHGGEPGSVEAAHSVIPRYICPFARAQIGHRMLKEQPYYSLVDMLIIATSCKHIKKAADIWNYFTDVPIHRLGLPLSHQHEDDLIYFIDSLKRTKKALEDFTGNTITDEKLRKAISIYNRMRALLNQIRRIRQTNPDTMSSLDFIKLHHASYLADPEVMITELESVCKKMEQGKVEASNGKPRLLLIAPNIAYGDYTVFKLIHDAGGKICGEQVCEGVRTDSSNVDITSKDLLEALANKYLINREVPCAFMVNSLRTRFDKMVELATRLQVDGIIWYQMRMCETYDTESTYFARHLKERNLPMLKIESEYEISNQQQHRTRVETFMEMLKRR